MAEERFFKMSENGSHEYCCTVVRVGELTPIEGSDFLMQTMVNGNSIVVSKDVKEGDIMIYAENETQLNEKFLCLNNLYEIGSRELNSNYHEVEKLLLEGKNDEAKKLCGFFNKHGRVKLIRLRGCPSFGFLFSIESMAKYNPMVNDINIEEYIGEDFDTVYDELFVKAYVPYVPPARGERRKSEKSQKKLERFDRLVPGEFQLHYDTLPLQKNMVKIRPDDVVNISLKVHGSSGIFSKVKTRTPLKLPFYKKWFNKFVDRTGWFKDLRVTDHIIEYGSVYSSRKVIKNEYINKNLNGGFYNKDIWGDINEWIYPLLDEGMSVYGEIYGYVDEQGKLIQGGYDYGCKPGEKAFMPYRITTSLKDGKKFEWNVSEVLEWTRRMLKEHPELKGKLTEIPVFYHGKLKDLYPELDVSNHWHDNVLEALRNDKERFGMEKDEPLCKNKVPREGICIRIDNDPFNECFKLKCYKFLKKEGEEISKGNVDMEMMENYSEEI